MGSALRAVSVIIPTYNCARYLGEALDSVASQTYRDLEIIVVDDGSTDGTPQLLARYGSAVRVVSQPNLGLPAARNAGIRAAAGRYLALLDADDIWLPEKLAVQMAHLAQHPDCAWICTDWESFDETGLLEASGLRRYPAWRDPDSCRALVKADFVNCSSLLLRRDCFDLAGRFDERLRAAEDTEFWVRMATRYPLCCIPRSLVRRRMRADSLSHDRVMISTYGALARRLILQHCRRHRPDLVPLARQLLAKHEYAAGRACFEAGRLHQARGYLLRAAAAGAEPIPAGLYAAACCLPPGAVRLVRRLKRRVAWLRTR